MLSRLCSLLAPLLLLQLLQLTSGAGYHYDRPSGPSAPAYSGHQFAALPTLHPLPPVPALPSLPTPRPLAHGYHAPPTAPAVSIVNHYLPAKPTGSVINHYLPSSQLSYHGVAPTLRPIQSVYTAPALTLSQPQPQPQLQPQFQFQPQPQPQPHPFDLRVPLAPPQPLRIPYGKQALIAPGESYVANGRQLKQYAVIELIDNDLDESPAPFLRSNFFDRYRAHIGASGTGALPPSASGGGIQIDSRANALVLEQQALSAQPRSQGQTQQSIALGSGGLGYVRLPNGNVYLGSGSLGYISGQQRVASVLEARTRADSTPDAVHFGHGPIGGVDNFLRF